jgi:1-acyl-sn-glycerol-3-phosphate acyltransferase
MNKFDAIRPFSDTEINDGILKVLDHPMMKALMSFCFPRVEDEIWKEQLKKTHSIRDFQCNFIYYGVKQVLEKSSDGLTTSGFEKLDKNTPYLYISNHRDIVLDTTFLNASLFENGKLMTSSAIGDNLVKRPFLKILAKLNRNFLVQRDLTPRELLVSSKLLAEYIAHLLLHENRSVWIAQREGRTKDGNDATNPGVLKMIGMGSDEPNLMDYFKKIKVVPVSISYEYDPTDALKMPQLIAESNNEVYIKEKNEDIMTLLSGIVGQKKRIHIHIGDVLDAEIDEIKQNFDTSNKQIQALAQVIDDSILSSYRLWPTNYIAYDILYNTNTYQEFYTENEKSLFERRMEMRIDHNNAIAKQGFLDMYANPVVNKLKYTNAV